MRTRPHRLRRYMKLGVEKRLNVGPTIGSSSVTILHLTEGPLSSNLLSDWVTPVPSQTWFEMILGSFKN